MPLRGALPHWTTEKITILRAPSAREVYWIGTFIDSLEPEFTGYHQGVIIAGAKTLNDASEHVVFVPLTSDKPKTGARNDLPPYIHKLEKNPSSDGREAWAVCNHVMTVRLSRLERIIGLDRLNTIAPKVSVEDFAAIIDCILQGVTVIRNRMDVLRKAALEKQKLDHDLELAALKASHAAAIEQAVLDELDKMTSPD